VKATSAAEAATTANVITKASRLSMNFRAPYLNRRRSAKVSLTR
jgi:hypothetical protein